VDLRLHACAEMQMLLPGLLVVSPLGGGLVDLSLRASKEGLPRPRVARAQEIDQVAPFSVYARMPACRR
jgi:hypothetical protein